MAVNFAVWRLMQALIEAILTVMAAIVGSILRMFIHRKLPSDDRPPDDMPLDLNR